MNRIHPISDFFPTSVGGQRHVLCHYRPHFAMVRARIAMSRTPRFLLLSAPRILPAGIFFPTGTPSARCSLPFLPPGFHFAIVSFLSLRASDTLCVLELAPTPPIPFHRTNANGSPGKIVSGRLG